MNVQKSHFGHPQPFEQGSRKAWDESYRSERSNRTDGRNVAAVGIGSSARRSVCTFAPCSYFLPQTDISRLAPRFIHLVFWRPASTEAMAGHEEECAAK